MKSTDGKNWTKANAEPYWDTILDRIKTFLCAHRWRYIDYFYSTEGNYQFNVFGCIKCGKKEMGKW